MNTRYVVMIAVLLGLPLLAHASCDQVKSDIDAKIKANGVAQFSLEVVSDDQADSSSGTVVGTCEGDKKIIYVRDGSSEGSMNSPASNSQPMNDSPAASSSS